MERLSVAAPHRKNMNWAQVATKGHIADQIRRWQQANQPKEPEVTESVPEPVVKTYSVGSVAVTYGKMVTLGKCATNVQQPKSDGNIDQVVLRKDSHVDSSGSDDYPDVLKQRQSQSKQPMEDFPKLCGDDEEDNVLSWVKVTNSPVGLAFNKGTSKPEEEVKLPSKPLVKTGCCEYRAVNEPNLKPQYTKEPGKLETASNTKPKVVPALDDSDDDMHKINQIMDISFKKAQMMTTQGSLDSDNEFVKVPDVSFQPEVPVWGIDCSLVNAPRSVFDVAVIPEDWLTPDLKDWGGSPQKSGGNVPNNTLPRSNMPNALPMSNVPNISPTVPTPSAQSFPVIKNDNTSTTATSVNVNYSQEETKSQPTKVPEPAKVIPKTPVKVQRDPFDDSSSTSEDISEVSKPTEPNIDDNEDPDASNVKIKESGSTDDSNRSSPHSLPREGATPESERSECPDEVPVDEDKSKNWGSRCPTPEPDELENDYGAPPDECPLSVSAVIHSVPDILDGDEVYDFDDKIDEVDDEPAKATNEKEATNDSSDENGQFESAEEDNREKDETDAIKENNCDKGLVDWERNDSKNASEVAYPHSATDSCSSSTVDFKCLERQRDISNPPSPRGSTPSYQQQGQTVGQDQGSNKTNDSNGEPGNSQGLEQRPSKPKRRRKGLTQKEILQKAEELEGSIDAERTPSPVNSLSQFILPKPFKDAKDLSQLETKRENVIETGEHLYDRGNLAGPLTQATLDAYSSWNNIEISVPPPIDEIMSNLTKEEKATTSLNFPLRTEMQKSETDQAEGVDDIVGNMPTMIKHSDEDSGHSTGSHMINAEAMVLDHVPSDRQMEKQEVRRKRRKPRVYASGDETAKDSNNNSRKFDTPSVSSGDELVVESRPTFSKDVHGMKSADFPHSVSSANQSIPPPKAQPFGEQLGFGHSNMNPLAKSYSAPNQEPTMAQDNSGLQQPWMNMSPQQMLQQMWMQMQMATQMQQNNTPTYTNNPWMLQQQPQMAAPCQIPGMGQMPQGPLTNGPPGIPFGQMGMGMPQNMWNTSQPQNQYFSNQMYPSNPTPQGPQYGPQQESLSMNYSPDIQCQQEADQGLYSFIPQGQNSDGYGYSYNPYNQNQTDIPPCGVQMGQDMNSIGQGMSYGYKPGVPSHHSDHSTPCDSPVHSRHIRPAPSQVHLKPESQETSSQTSNHTEEDTEIESIEQHPAPSRERRQHSAPTGERRKQHTAPTNSLPPSDRKQHSATSSERKQHSTTSNDRKPHKSSSGDLRQQSSDRKEQNAPPVVKVEPPALVDDGKQHSVAPDDRNEHATPHGEHQAKVEDVKRPHTIYSELYDRKLQIFLAVQTVIISVLAYLVLTMLNNS